MQVDGWPHLDAVTATMTGATFLIIIILPICICVFLHVSEWRYHHGRMIRKRDFHCWKTLEMDMDATNRHMGTLLIRLKNGLVHAKHICWWCLVNKNMTIQLSIQLI